MDGVAVVVAALAGAVGGAAAGPLADRIGLARYGPDTDGYDPEDEALAPLTVPTTRTQRLGLVLLGALGAAALAWQLPRGDVVLLFGVLLAAHVTAMVVDLQWLRLPNTFTYPAAAVAVAGTLALSARYDVTTAGTWVGAFFYPVVLVVFDAAFRLIRGTSGIGLGDVKLAISLGASAGWLGGVLAEGPSADLVAPSPVLAALSVTIYVMLLGTFLGALVGGLLVRSVHREVPFGPALVAGWLVVVLLADRIV